MFGRVCLCCSESSSHDRCSTHPLHDNKNTSMWLVCLNCDRSMKLSCAFELPRTVKASNVPEGVKKSSNWLTHIGTLYQRTQLHTKDIFLDNCMSCELSACLDPSVRPSIMKMPSPTTYPFQLAWHEKDESSHAADVVPIHSSKEKDGNSDVTYTSRAK